MHLNPGGQDDQVDKYDEVDKGVRRQDNLHQMQFGSYLQFVAAIMGFFGIILTALGVVCLTANRKAGLPGLPREKSSLEQVKKLTMQKNFFVSGFTLIVLSILGVAAPLVFNLSERQVVEGYYGVAVYAGVALGTVISVFVFGFTAAFNEWRVERRKG